MREGSGGPSGWTACDGAWPDVVLVSPITPGVIFTEEDSRTFSALLIHRSRLISASKADWAKDDISITPVCRHLEFSTLQIKDASI